MPSTSVKVDTYLEPIAGLTGNKHLRSGGGRHTRPSFARFDTRSSMGGLSAEVDFIWRAAAKRRMRAMFVVPVDERKKLTTAGISSVSNQYSSRALVLHRLD